ncbi:MAG: DUF2892 domain-containing protein [Myxococcaceae bacterium]|nr:DUF2892 domain-containing protein [Myxococcaceae bacterium]
MIRNEANWDRILRVFFGVVLLSMIFMGPQTWWGLIGVVPLLTGLVGYCPLYQLFGVSSCSVSGSHKPRAS